MSKYHSRKTEVDGIVFDSMKEARRYQELKLLQKAGLIYDLRLQERIEIIPKTDKYRARYYVCDFTYIDTEQKCKIYEDVKGVRTPVYLLKRAIMYWRHGIDIKEI